MNVIDINDINSYVGEIPMGYDLVVYEKSDTPASGLYLYGFDEVGLFDDSFNMPAYCFLRSDGTWVG
jgi:hypothetical protein